MSEKVKPGSARDWFSDWPAWLLVFCLLALVATIAVVTGGETPEPTP